MKLIEGKRVRIQIIGERCNKWHLSHVMSIEDREICIKWPVLKDKSRMALSPGDMIRIQWSDSVGFYSAKTFIISCHRFVEARFYIPALPEEEIENLNKRAHFRLPLELGCEIFLPPKDFEDSTSVQTISGKTVDISATGCAVSTNYFIQTGTSVGIHIRLDKSTLLKTSAEKVTDVSQKNKDRNYKYCCGFHFSDMDDRNRDILVKFMNRMQIILSRKKII